MLVFDLLFSLSMLLCLLPLLPRVMCSLGSLLSQCSSTPVPDPGLLSPAELQEMVNLNRGVMWDKVFAEGSAVIDECTPAPAAVLSITHCEHQTLPSDLEVYRVLLCSKRCPWVAHCFNLTTENGPAWRVGSRWPQRKRYAPTVGFDWVIGQDLEWGGLEGRSMLRHLFKPTHPRRGLLLSWSTGVVPRGLVETLIDSEALHPRMYWRDEISEQSLQVNTTGKVLVFKRHPHAVTIGP